MNRWTKHSVVVGVLSCALLLGGRGYANFSYFFGSGTTHVARAGALHHEGNEFQGFLNPGFGSFAPPSHGVALVFNQVNLAPLENILLQHPSFPHAEALPERGTLAFPEPLLWGAQMSFTLPVFTQFEDRKFRLHVSGFVPFSETLYLGTKSTFIPSYVFYEGRSRHLDGHASASCVILPGVLGFGGGVTMALNAVSRMSLIMDASSNQVTSDARTQVVPELSYFAGVYVRPVSWLHVSAMGHTQEAWGFEVSADSNAVVWENTDVGIDINGQSTYNFVPHRVVLATTVDMNEEFSVTPQVEYHVWSLYKSQRIKVNLPGTGLTPAYPAVQTKDIVVPRLGVAWKALSWASLYSGVAFMPSPITDISGVHNDVDASRVIGGLGVELTGKNFLMGDSPDSRFRFGLFGQLHYLIPRTVVKTTEAIGSPGYELKGTAYVIGTQFSFDV